MGALAAATACLGGLTSCLPVLSLYFHTRDVSYRAPLSGSQLLDWKNESLFEGKYRFPHIGFKPELAPPTDAAWGNVRSFRTADGSDVVQEFWCPATDSGGNALPAHAVRGVVVLLVGLGDSVEKNGHLAAFLASKGFAVHGMDYPGYGQSQRDALMGRCVLARRGLALTTARARRGLALNNALT